MNSKLEPQAPARAHRLALALALSLAAGAAARAEGSPHPCASITADAQRLACFDKAFPRAAAPGQGKAAAPASGLPAEAGTQAQQFGLPAPAPGKVLDAIEAQVVSVGRLSRGERVFQLDNGQRWAETQAEARGLVAAGDTVRVERGAFGSFLLVTPSRVGLRVRRLQ